MTAHAVTLSSVSIPDRVYFRIGEVAALLGVEAHVVRFWQEQFGQPRPTRSKTGRLLYTQADVRALVRIRELLYGQRFTIEGARRVLADERKGRRMPDDGRAGDVIAKATRTDPPVSDARSVDVTPPAHDARSERETAEWRARAERAEREVAALRSRVDALAEAERRHVARAERAEKAATTLREQLREGLRAITDELQSDP